MLRNRIFVKARPSGFVNPSRDGSQRMEIAARRNWANSQAIRDISHNWGKRCALIAYGRLKHKIDVAFWTNTIKYP